MQPQADNFHDSLQCENNSKQDIEYLQDVGDHVRLVVVFHSHGDHIQHDRDHDTQLKLCTDGNVVKYCLDFILQSMVFGQREKHN